MLRTHFPRVVLVEKTFELLIWENNCYEQCSF